MAGQARHLKVKGGRFYARLAVPARLRQIIGKTELVVPLGGERRAAMKALPAAVATLQRQIDAAESKIAANRLDDPRRPITTQDYGRAVWARYQAMLEADDATRAAYPSAVQIEAATERTVQHIQDKQIDLQDPLAVLAASLDLMRLNSAREIDQTTRQIKLDALRADLAAGRTHLVEHEIDDFLLRNSLTAPEGSAERAVLAKQIIRAEIEALERTRERDRGDYGGKPADPAVKPPAATADAPAPVSIKRLWNDYVKSRQILGSMRDGGRRQVLAIYSLVDFVKHDDANRVTKKDMADWLDHTLATLSPATISKVYLPTIRSLFRWAHEKDRIKGNPAADIRQSAPKKIHNRERGYTTPEATVVLTAARDYQPYMLPNGTTRETPQNIAARRWVPWILAFTGARVAEICQLRREDIREEAGAHIIRITPEAGGTKTGQWRDVPLHPQIIEMGFLDYVSTVPAGPLFHTATDPAKYLTAAKRMSNRIGDWLQEKELVPAGVQPSHGWRHRLKTIGREVGIQDRVLDAIQGHAARTAGDGYGDITLKTRIDAINRLPRYEIPDPATK